MLLPNKKKKEEEEQTARCKLALEKTDEDRKDSRKWDFQSGGKKKKDFSNELKKKEEEGEHNFWISPRRLFLNLLSVVIAGHLLGSYIGLLRPLNHLFIN